MDGTGLEHPPQDPNDQVTSTNSAMLECCACMEEYAFGEFEFIDNDVACHRCIRQIFSNAAADESNYPPRWGLTELSVYQYSIILGPFIVEAFKQKVKEYRIPWDWRVYCPTRSAFGVVCGNYVGPRMPDLGSSQQKCKKCRKCGSRVCLVCKEHVVKRSHECDAVTQEEEDDFKDLQRGKDWQTCPNCKTKVELRDGCNHVACACGQEFCFICGAPAQGNSHHWADDRGGPRCPRYNQPVPANALLFEGQVFHQRQPFHVLDTDAHRQALENMQTIAQRRHQVITQTGAAVGIENQASLESMRRLNELARRMVELGSRVPMLDETRTELARLHEEHARLRADLAAVQASESRIQVLAARAEIRDPGIHGMARRGRQEVRALESGSDDEVPQLVRRENADPRRGVRRQNTLIPPLRGVTRRSQDNQHSTDEDRPFRHQLLRPQRDPPADLPPLTLENRIRRTDTAWPAGGQFRRNAIVVASPDGSTAMPTANQEQGLPRATPEPHLNARSSHIAITPPLSHLPVPRQRMVQSSATTNESNPQIALTLPHGANIGPGQPLNPSLIHPGDTPRRAPRRRAMLSPRPQNETVDEDRFTIDNGLRQAWHQRQRPRLTSPERLRAVQTQPAEMTEPTSDTRMPRVSRRTFMDPPFTSWTGRAPTSSGQQLLPVDDVRWQNHFHMQQSQPAALQLTTQPPLRQPGIPERVSSLQHQVQHRRRQAAATQLQHPHAHFPVPQIHTRPRNPTDHGFPQQAQDNDVDIRALFSRVRASPPPPFFNTNRAMAFPQTIPQPAARLPAQRQSNMNEFFRSAEREEDGGGVPAPAFETAIEESRADPDLRAV